MDKAYDHTKYEAQIYRRWEKSGAFTAGEREGKKPYVILMPPPNANASLHAGHAMYSVEDVLIRFRRMQGYFALWVPGMDHAGIETQEVFERRLAKQGKSRLDFDRQTLFADIYRFVQENSGTIYRQFKTLGFSADWNRSIFTLDPPVVKQVCATFKKLHADGLLYRDNYLVNYCTHCGTTLADLEVNHHQRPDPLYFMKYGPFTIATVRPETKFRDTALAVNPKDRRYTNAIGKTFRIRGLLGEVDMKIIPDPEVDPQFGTGIMKVTPAHDPHDFELGKKFNLPVTPIIDLDGRMRFDWLLEKTAVDPKYRARAEKYHGKKVADARKLMVADLKADGLLVKVDEHYTHSVPICYRCKHDLEALVLPNWFVRVATLKEPAVQAVKNGRTRFTPARYTKDYSDWMEIMHDWPISRQIVWGIRIPVWYKVDPQAEDLWARWIAKDGQTHQGLVKHSLQQGHTLAQIEAGLQKLTAFPSPHLKYVISASKPRSGEYLPETDTFDTWFSSGQWPLVTLGFPKGHDYQRFYPTQVMGTNAEIIKFWVSRMIMFGLYLAGDVPFETVYLWSLVVDKKGQKMSKSRGNVVNPSEFIDKYGADALRLALVYGIAPGSRIPLSEEKVRGMRNFANKVWNVCRFAHHLAGPDTPAPSSHPDDVWISQELGQTVRLVTQALESFRLNQAAETIYDFVWHKLADVYLEKIKSRRQAAFPTLKRVVATSLKLLHPFMPFVTEAAWQELGWETRQLIVTDWPTTPI